MATPTEHEVEQALLRVCLSPSLGRTGRVPSRWVATSACPPGYPNQAGTLRQLKKLEAKGIAERLPGHYSDNNAYSLWWHTAVSKPSRTNVPCTHSPVSSNP